MAIDFKTLIATLETDLRAGHIAQVTKRLASIRSTKVPREHRLPLANIARRADAIAIGLRLLTPIVLAPDKKLLLTPTSDELAEYAILLQKNGSVNEAMKLLERLSLQGPPQTALFLAFCHFNRWEYKSAIPHLQSYLAKDLEPYARTVGLVNLAAAQAMCKQHEAARETLAIARRAAEVGGNKRLVANCRELTAQIAVQSGNFGEAQRELEEAARILGEAKVYDSFFIRKWKAVITSHERKSVEPLRELAADAAAAGLWETCREADLQSLKIEFQPNLYDKLVFGTPFSDYRARVLSELGRTESRKEIVYGPKEAPVFDLLSGELEGKSWVRKGSKVHKAIELLLRDFYRPLNVAGIFAALCPGEHFDIFTSPDRVHQVLKRTRSFLEANGNQLRLLQRKSRYWIGTEVVSIRVPLEREATDWFDVHLRLLVDKLSKMDRESGEFTSQEVATWLELTEWRQKRFFKLALESESIVRVGSGAYTSYRLASATDKDQSDAA